jgi:endoglucanase
MRYRIYLLLASFFFLGCGGGVDDSLTFTNDQVATRAVRPSDRVARQELPPTDFEVRVVSQNDWGQGFVVEAELVNRTARRLDDWRVVVELDAEITDIWNARVVSREGARYTLEGLSYNSWVEAGQKVSFGFQGNPGGLQGTLGFEVLGQPAGVPPTPEVTPSPEVPPSPEVTPTPGAETPPSQPPSSSSDLQFRVADDWGSGFVADVMVMNSSQGPLNDWKIELDVDREITNLWNARIISRSGSLYIIEPENYNRTIASNGSISFGFQGTPGGPVVKSLRLVSVSSPPDPQPDPTPTPTPTASPTTPFPTPVPPVGNAPGYFHTEGSKIVDSEGRVVKLTGVNWFGLETSNFAPHGLWARSMDSMLDQISELGYNCLRVPFCTEMFDQGSVPNSINTSLNPDLAGLNAIGILDRLIEKCEERGLKVILDRHRPSAAGQSALWYTDRYSEERWISDWEMLAERYQDQPTVVGFDLHNEPHGAASWGDGNLATDWRLAAERAGNRILAVNPQLLVLVEGVENVNGIPYWWGGNLRAAGSHPVRLSVNGRLVYSPHDYPASVFDQDWFHAADYPANLEPLWNATWGYLVRDHQAPVVLGEFGTLDQTASDRLWFRTMAAYLLKEDMSFTYWSWNPNSGDTGGLLQDDWTTLHEAKHQVLAPLLDLGS